MTSANVLIEVEMIVDGKTIEAAQKEAFRVMYSALDKYGWAQVRKVTIINTRDD